MRNSKNRKYAIGVDIGGTKISVTIGDAEGKILLRDEIPTLTGKRTAESLRALQLSISNLIAESGKKRTAFVGIGIGVPGPVDPQKGIVPYSPNLPGWKNIPLARILGKKFNLPVKMINDAKAAALGEKIFGQGRGLRDFIYMTVSTGIGGGIVINGNLHLGKSFVAGEVGHMKIVPNGDLCKCGRKGCLEAYASGTAIANYAAGELKRSGKKSILRIFLKQQALNAKLVGKAAKRGDAFAVFVYKRAGFYLGIGIANLLNILNPEKIILGGGVWKSAPPDFWDSMMGSVKDNAWPEAVKTVKIVRSSLGGHIGDIGTLALVFESLGAHSSTG